MDRDQLIDALKTSRFADQIDLLEPSIRPSVRLATETVELEKLPIGASRMGGVPDLPEGFDWPRHGDRPLDFLCQIDLSEVQRHGPLIDLPQEGWLAFFYDNKEQPWGHDPNTRDQWRVAFFDVGPKELRRLDHPATIAALQDGAFKFATRQLHMEAEACLPHVFDFVQPLDLEDDEEFDDYDRFLEETGTTCYPFSMNNRLLGHPSIVQGDMRMNCSEVSSGIFRSDPAGYRKARRGQVLLSDPKDWQLLLQIDTDCYDSTWQWGLGGRLYYWIREQDLAAENFDAVWLVLQT